jgi:acyl carrier protein
MATIQDKAKAFIATKLNVSEREITPEKNLFNDLGADSLDVVELLMILEHEFNVKFSEDDTANVKTVGDLYDMIEKYANIKRQ